MVFIRRFLFVPIITLFPILMASVHPAPALASTPIVTVYKPTSATEVSVDASIWFGSVTNRSEPLDSATVNYSNFNVFDVTASIQIPGSVLLTGASSSIVHFYPSHELHSGHRYRVSIKNDIRNIHGERLYFQGISESFNRPYTYTWEFTTRPDVLLMPFPDVSLDSPYAQAIAYLYSHNVVSGYDDGTYGPRDSVKRAQFAKLICGALGLHVVEGVDSQFGDLGPNDPNSLYPHDYIATMANMGITQGTSPGVFSPWREITRAQVVTLIVRGAVLLAADEDVPVLKDPEGNWGTLGNFDQTHGIAMSYAEYNRLLSGLVGFGPGWDPWQPMTREEISQVLYNLMLFLAG